MVLLCKPTPKPITVKLMRNKYWIYSIFTINTFEPGCLRQEAAQMDGNLCALRQPYPFRRRDAAALIMVLQSFIGITSS